MTKNTSISSYTPKVGDLAAIDNNGNISTGPDHTGIVIAVNGNSLTMAEGNTGAGTNATRTVKTYTYYKGGTYWYRSGAAGTVVVGFGNPAYQAVDTGKNKQSLSGFRQAFIVEKDGSLTDIKVEKSIDPLFDKEAVRVVKTMPKWEPGMWNGKPARVKYCIPIRFRLAQNN